jgi:peptidoglycan hydrolase-like protein with peptidoglycan-binding domain
MSGLARISVFLFPVSLVMWYPNLPAIAQGNVESVQKQVQSPAEFIVNRPVLKSGSKGEAVSELQAALQLLGFYRGSIDGVYSQNTAIAVTRFQQAAGLNPDGIVNQQTWQTLFPLTATTAINPRLANNLNSEMEIVSLEKESTTEEPATESNNTENSEIPTVDLPTLKMGMRGPDVFWLQKRLQTMGFFAGSIDGIFGKDTQTAVRATQEKYGLKPDGIVGTATWQAILP